MDIINKKDLGLIVWGTKRGKVVFFTNNIQGKAETLNKYLPDIRTPVNISAVRQKFYSFEYVKNNLLFTLYSTAYDVTGSYGYFAISIIVNNGIVIQLSKLPEVLDELSNLYWEKYVATGTNKNQITNISEDSNEFVAVLSSSGITNSGDLIKISINNRNSFAQTKYKNNEELIGLFENFDRKELRNIKQLVLLPDDIKAIKCAYDNIELPFIIPGNSNIERLFIQVKDKNDQVLDKIKLQITIDDNYSELTSDYGDIPLSNINKNSKIKIQYTGNAYNLFEKEDTVKYLIEELGQAKIVVTLIPKKNEDEKNKEGKNGFRRFSDDDELKDKLEKLEQQPPDKKRPEKKPPIIKKDNEDKKDEAGKKPGKKLIMGISGGIIAVVSTVAVFFFLNAPNNYNYAKLKHETDSIVKPILDPNWEYKVVQIVSANNFLDQKLKKIDTIKKTKEFIIIEDSITFLSEYKQKLGEIGDGYFKDRVNRLTSGISFKLDETNELINFVSQKERFKKETKKLQNYLPMCLAIAKADSALEGLIKSNSELEKIRKNLLDLSKGKDKNIEQKHYLLLYRKLVNNRKKANDYEDYNKEYTIYELNSYILVTKYKIIENKNKLVNFNTDKKKEDINMEDYYYK